MKAGCRDSRWARVLDAARRDDGIALATVAAISAILFLLATTLVMLSTQTTVNASNQVQRTRALHAADAGINDYLYHLSRSIDYWSSHSDTASSTAGTSWTVHATRPNGVGPVFLTAVGTVPAANGAKTVSRTVKASVQSPTFADYTFLFNTSVSIGSGAIIKGNVRSNSSISNDGEITGNAYAASSYGGSGKCDGTIYQNYGTQSFATVDYGLLKSTAATDSTDFSSLPTYEQVNATGTPVYRAYLGYNVVLNGGGGTITPIRSLSTNAGTMTVDASRATSFTVGPHGVLYFDDPIWVSGTYGCKVTIADAADVEERGSNGIYYSGASGFNTTGTVVGSLSNIANSTVYLWNNLVPDDAASDHVCGIVAKGDVSVPSEYDTMPTNLTVQSAILTTMGSMHADMVSGQTKNHFQFTGARAQMDDGGFTSTNEGFDSRDYWYDQRLNMTPPPNFPPLGDGSLKVQSWVEN